MYWSLFLLLFGLGLGQTICEKYSTALNLSQMNFMDTVVNQVLEDELANPTIRVFFDGTAPAGSTDFTKSTTNFSTLTGHFTTFFGSALGCNDPAFPKYTGNMDMKVVHSGMPIGITEFGLFNDIFVGALAKLGVSTADQATIRGLLNSYAGDIVNLTYLCPKYARSLGVSQIDLMGTLISSVINEELGDPLLMPFFDGSSPPGSTNYLGSTMDFGRFAGGLIAFFGSAFGCQESGFPSYTGPTDLKVPTHITISQRFQALHSKMPISKVTFNSFNDHFIKAITDIGFEPEDRTRVRAFLDSFVDDIVNPTYICSKYASALHVSQIDLMTTVVGEVINSQLGDPQILPYFDGTSDPTSTNFLGNSIGFNNLANGLIAFFGEALGCTDAGFPKYTGPDMKTVHANMPISSVELDRFNDNFISALGGLGVDITDQDMIRTILESYKQDIINPTYICRKYAKTLGISQIDLMSSIVSTIFNSEFSNTEVVVYFDGSKPAGSINFLGNIVEMNRLASHLIAFFGKPLGCTEIGFPVYAGRTDMKSIHAPMNIPLSTFNKFSDIFLKTLGGFGLTSEDIALVQDILRSYESAIVNPSAVPPEGGVVDDLLNAGYVYKQSLDCDISVHWKPVNKDLGVVEFAVRRATDGFVALGFPKSNKYQMIGSDAVIGWVDAVSGQKVGAYYLQSKDVSGIVSNPKLVLSDVSATEIDGITTVYFTRPLNAGYNPITDLTCVTVIAASLDGTDSIAKHSCNVNQALNLNLETGSSTTIESGDYRRDIHGALMIGGWSCFLIMGAFIARFGKSKLHHGRWLKAHQIFQGLGMVFTTAGLVTAFVMVDGEHFKTAWHGQLGISIMVIAYLQVIAGIIRPHAEEGGPKTRHRKVWEVLHPWTGRILLLAASINIVAGINQWWSWWVYVVFGCFIGLIILSSIVLEIKGVSRYHVPERV